MNETTDKLESTRTCENISEYSTLSCMGKDFKETASEWKLIVAGGASGGSDVEIVDVEGTRFSCQKPAALPVATTDPMGAYHNGRFIVCGGNQGGTYVADCYQLEPASNTWTQLASMTEAKGTCGITSSDHGLLIAGGRTQDALTDTFEYYDGTSWTAGPKVPQALKAPVLVQLNSSHTAFVGGETGLGGVGSSFSNKLYLFNWNTNMWITAANLLRANGRHQATVTPAGHIIVAGGYPGGYTDLVEEYDPATDVWTDRPKLIYGWSCAEMTVIGGKPAILGGMSASKSVEDRIAVFDGTSWSHLTDANGAIITFAKARYWFAHAMVPVSALPGCA